MPSSDPLTCPNCEHTIVVHHPEHGRCGLCNCGRQKSQGNPDTDDIQAGDARLQPAPPCPRCAQPMTPTTERGARWYCRPCVLLVIPMGPTQ